MKIRSAEHNKHFLFFFKKFINQKGKHVIEKQAKDMNRQVIVKNTLLHS